MTSPAVLLVAPFSFGAALLLTPLVRRLAARTGYIDHPAPRKHHPEPTPLLGGVAVAASMVAGPVLATVVAGTGAGPGAGADLSWPRAGVLCGAALSLALGLVDDRRPMRPLGKLIGQIAAALLLVFWGAREGALAYHPLWIAAAIVGVVALLNAINFLDAMDGIVAAVVPVAAAGFLALSLLFGADVDQALGWALVGACAGFLVYNAPPARIFLGDAGSHLLGFALAALALRALDNSLTLPHVAGVLCILSFPLFDVIFVTWDRLWGKRPIAVGSTDHSTHRLGMICGRWGTVALIFAVMTASTALGVGVWNEKNDVAAGVAVSILGLGYAILGAYLRRKRPTPRFDT